MKDGLESHIDTSSSSSTSAVMKEHNYDNNNNNNNTNNDTNNGDDDDKDDDDDDRELIALKEQLVQCKSFCDVDISKACLCAVSRTTNHCCSTMIA